MSGPLSGLRVLDLSTTPAGAFCARLLGDDGAEVVTVEEPGGGPIRNAAPFVGDKSDPERSLVFWFLGINKRSVVLSLQRPGERRLARRLAAKADILIETFPGGSTVPSGLEYDALRAPNPALVHVSLTPFGRSGPYSGYKADALTLDALAGTMFFRGEPGRPPLKMGGMVADAVGGIAGYCGALAALYQRFFTGRGQHVDVSHREALFSLAEIYSSYYIYMGVVVRRSFDQMFLLPGRISCRDGDVVPFFYGEAGWENFCLFLERPGLLHDPRFARFESRIRHAAELCAIVEAALKHETRRGLVARAQEWRLPFGYVARVDEAVESETNSARSFVREVEHPAHGRFRYPGSPVRVTMALHRADRPPPLLGADTERVLATWLNP